MRSILYLLIPLCLPIVLKCKTVTGQGFKDVIVCPLDGQSVPNAIVFASFMGRLLCVMSPVAVHTEFEKHL